jgi:hypothetical protein
LVTHIFNIQIRLSDSGGVAGHAAKQEINPEVRKLSKAAKDEDLSYFCDKAVGNLERGRRYALYLHIFLSTHQ